MITGLSLNEARNILYPNGSVRRTITQDLKRALQIIGWKTGYKTIPTSLAKLSALERDAIVKTWPGPKTNNWHWLVWDAKRKRLLDPEERDKPRQRIYAYLEVWRDPT